MNLTGKRMLKSFDLDDDYTTGGSSGTHARTYLREVRQYRYSQAGS